MREHAVLHLDHAVLLRVETKLLPERGGLEGAEFVREVCKSNDCPLNEVHAALREGACLRDRAVLKRDRHAIGVDHCEYVGRDLEPIDVSTLDPLISHQQLVAVAVLEERYERLALAGPDTGA